MQIGEWAGPGRIAEWVRTVFVQSSGTLCGRENNGMNVY